MQVSDLDMAGSGKHPLLSSWLLCLRRACSWKLAVQFSRDNTPSSAVSGCHWGRCTQCMSVWILSGVLSSCACSCSDQADPWHREVSNSTPLLPQGALVLLVLLDPLPCLPRCLSRCGHYLAVGNQAGCPPGSHCCVLHLHRPAHGIEHCKVVSLPLVLQPLNALRLGVAGGTGQG